MRRGNVWRDDRGGSEGCDRRSGTAAATPENVDAPRPRGSEQGPGQTALRAVDRTGSARRWPRHRHQDPQGVVTLVDLAQATHSPADVATRPGCQDQALSCRAVCALAGGTRARWAAGPGSDGRPKRCDSSKPGPVLLGSLDVVTERALAPCSARRSVAAVALHVHPGPHPASAKRPHPIHRTLGPSAGHRSQRPEPSTGAP